MQINYWMKFSDTSSVATILTLEIFNPDSIRREFSSKFIKIIDESHFLDIQWPDNFFEPDFASKFR